MGTEIERKFLLQSDDWRNGVQSSTRLIQGYLLRGDNMAIRVRIKGESAEINGVMGGHGQHTAIGQVPFDQSFHNPDAVTVQ